MSKPIVAFDLETTSAEKNTARIVQFCFIKITKDGREVYSSLVNPLYPITPGAQEVHGITDKMVENSPTFKELSKDIASFIKGCDLLGYNSNRFDVPILSLEFGRSNMDLTQILGKDYKLFDAFVIYSRTNPRTLEACYEQYTGEKMENAHDAAVDVHATIEVFSKMMQSHKDQIPNKASELDLFCNYDTKRVDLDSKFSYDEDGEIIFNFGSKKGDIAKNDRNYLQWMISANFHPDTTRVAEELLNQQKKIL